MQFTNPNTGSFVWSRDAKDVVLDSILPASATVQFTVKLGAAAVASFALTAVSGSITLRYREILEAVLPKSIGTLLSTADYDRYSNDVTIVATLGNSTVSTTKRCFRGGSDELRPAFPHGTQWLTWKPQVTRTWAWAKEFLSLVIPNSTKMDVSAKVYFTDHTDTTLTLCTFALMTNGYSIGLVNCSPSVINSLVPAGKTVAAYDVDAGSSIKAHRFILQPTRLRGREFLFVNSLGVLDTVFAAGDVSRETEMAVSAASIDSEEVELSNGAVERFKVQTGWIRERRMMDQWQDFFRSTERYVLLQGDVVRRIVVDAIETEMTEHNLSSATITYHYAKAFTGRYYEDTAIGAYDYTENE